jgi:hypothetical protein
VACCLLNLFGSSAGASVKSASPPPVPVSLPDAFAAVLLAGTTPSSDAGLCAQSVVAQLAPAVAAAANSSRLGVGAGASLDLAVSSSTCSSCLSAHHSCPTGVAADGRSLNYQPVPWTWKWRCRAATSSHAAPVTLGPGQPQAHLTPCRMQSSVALILIIALPAVGAGVLFGVATAYFLRRRRRMKQQEATLLQDQQQQVPACTSVMVDATPGSVMGLPMMYPPQGGQTKGKPILPMTPPPLQGKAAT